MNKHWIVESCFDCTGISQHVKAGDQLTLTESGEQSLVITRPAAGPDRGEEVILNVTISQSLVEPSRLDFPRSSGSINHKPSNHFRGHLAVRPSPVGCEQVLHLILGYRCEIPEENSVGPGDDDDDDTEVVVATKPAGK